jgi:hypothetical protein
MRDKDQKVSPFPDPVGLVNPTGSISQCCVLANECFLKNEGEEYGERRKSIEYSFNG